MTEAFLQYVWQHKLFEGSLHTVEGVAVEVERVGEINRDAGPDFIGARLRMGDVLWVGNVEVHVRASDWNMHNHSADKNYNNVILHVVYQYDADVVLENGKGVATLELASYISTTVEERYNSLLNKGKTDAIPCESYLDRVPSAFISMTKDRMLIERLERKSTDVKRIYGKTNGSWEETCYILVARYFGGKSNSFPFEMLAERTPMSVVVKIRDDRFRVEALLYGQAGLLSADFEDEYPRRLKKEYTYLCRAYGLEPMPSHLWKFFRLRPFSFPTVRISQFADLLCKSRNLFSKLLETDEPDKLFSFFKLSASDYWTNHYSFDRLSRTVCKETGDAFVRTLIINAWIPLLFEYAANHSDETRKGLAIGLLEKMPVEDNRILRKWSDAKVVAENAADGQALIQLYNDYCSRRRCLDCPLAFRLLKI